MDCGTCFDVHMAMMIMKSQFGNFSISISVIALQQCEVMLAAYCHIVSELYHLT